MVGHFVGYTANAAIGVSWQIILVVIVFISSTFTGMAVLVARFAGANQPDKVNRVVYQAFLTAFGLSVVLAAIGYAAAPALLRLVNAAPDVQAEALPFLRAMFMGIFGMLMFFMLSGAFRAAGDPQTPLRLGVIMTVLTIVFNVILIPMFGTLGAAFGTILSSTTVTVYGIWRITRPDSVIHFEKGMSHAPDFTIIRSLFRFGLPTGVQGIAMNIGGVLMLRFIGSLEQSAAAQAAYAVGYTELFSLITWTSVGLMGASATIAGQNLGANNPQRAIEGVKVAAQIGLGVAVVIGAMFVLIPGPLLAIFGMTDPMVLSIGRLLLLYLSVSGSVHHRRAQLHRRTAGHRRHAQPALHLDHLPGDHPARTVHAVPGDVRPRPGPHLDGDRRRPRDARDAERREVQAGQVASDRGRYRTRTALKLQSYRRWSRLHMPGNRPPLVL